MKEIVWEYAYEKDKKNVLIRIIILSIACLFLITFLFYTVGMATYENSYENSILVLTLFLIICAAAIAYSINQITVPRSKPYKIGFSSDRVLLRYRNKFYDIDIDKNNIEKIIRSRMSYSFRLKIILRTGVIIKIDGIQKFIDEVHSNLIPDFKGI